MQRIKPFHIAVTLFLLSIILTGCGASTGSQASPNDQLTAFVKDAPKMVQEAYEYAMANPHELEKYPCYCGCGKMGHTSNRSCYIKDIAADGTITFDDHALGCGICVEITRDVMRLKAEGKSSQEIRRYIDAQYSQYGPATNTAFPTD